MLAEPFQRITSLQFLKLDWRVLIYELIYRQIAASNANLDATFLNSHVDFPRAKGVDALTLSHEHNFQLVPVRIVVDKLSHLLVDRIILEWHVDCNSCLQVYDVVLESAALKLQLLDLLEQVQALLVRTVHAVFEL